MFATSPNYSGWSWSCVATVDSNGRPIFVADAHRDDGKRFVVRADEKLTAFMDLESALVSGQPNSVQSETYIRGNNNKKKIKQADFPAEAPESNSHKYEAGNTEHSLDDLSSECSKECSLAEFNEPCDRANNNGDTKQAEKHSAHEVFPKYCHSLVVQMRVGMR